MNDSRKLRYKQKIEQLERFYALLKDWLDSNDIDTIEENKKTMELFAIYHSGQLVIEVITDIVAMVVKDIGFLVKDG